MKVSELLATVSANMPSDIEDGSIINWINILEDDVYSRVINNLNMDPFISDDGLTSRERFKPEIKNLDKAEEQELSLLGFGIRWGLLYEYFIYAQIALLKEEFGKGNNYIQLYNSLADDFYSMYNSRFKTDRDWR